jgi:hypothetical protein
MAGGPNQEIRSAALGSPAVGSATAVKAAYTLLAGASPGITAGITNPDAPRNVTVQGNAAGIVGNVVVHGTDYAGNVITETLALNATNLISGNKAFRAVSSIDYPAKTNGSGDTVTVGTGAKLGLPAALPHDQVLSAFLGGVREATRPTVATAADLASNTITLNSALNGSAVLVDFYA